MFYIFYILDVANIDTSKVFIKTYRLRPYQTARCQAEFRESIDYKQGNCGSPPSRHKLSFQPVHKKKVII